MTRTPILLLALTLAGCRIGSGSHQAAADRDLAGGRYLEAQTAYRDLDRRQPGDGRVLHQLGAALYRLGKMPEAAAAFRAAAARLAEPRDRARAQHNLGNALAASGRPTEALEAYRQALGLEDRESTRLNYELVRDRLAMDNPPADGAGLRPNPARDSRLFESARELDISPDTRAAREQSPRRTRDW